MSREKFNLNSDVAKLVNHYLTMTDCSFDELVNKALHFYIAKQLGSKETRAALRQKDPDEFRFLDHLNNDYLQSHGDL